MADWVPVLKQTALSNNGCYGAGIANGDDGELFVAGDVDHDGLHWDSVYKDNYVFETSDDNGNPVKLQIDEKFTIKEVFEKKKSTNGIFLGGEKYTFASYDPALESGSFTFECVCGAKNKGGCHLIKTPGNYIVIVVYDETRGQDKTVSRMAAFNLAEYLASNDKDDLNNDQEFICESDSSEKIPETDEFLDSINNEQSSKDSHIVDSLNEIDSGVDISDLSSVKERIEIICGILAKWKVVSEASNLTRKRESFLSELKQLVAIYYGYSDELSDYFFKLFNPIEAIQFFESNEQPLPMTIRTNTLKTKRKELAVALINRGANVDPIGDWTKEGLVVHSSKVPIGATPEYLSGHYMLQSASSLIPVLALSPKQNDKVLDMCAAPGGKTTHIAQIMNNSGVIFANDVNKERCKALVSNIHSGAELLKILPKMDKILLDAPCSGLGVISRDPSIKVKRGLKDIQKNSNLQRQLLSACVRLVKPGGVVVYSTCSLSVEENEQVINYVLNQYKSVKLVPLGLDIGSEAFSSFRGKTFHPSISKYARRFYPHRHSLDGFFVAKLVKSASADGTITNGPLKGDSNKLNGKDSSYNAKNKLNGDSRKSSRETSKRSIKRADTSPVKRTKY